MSEVTLSEVCELIVDCPHSTAIDEGKGYPLVRTPNIGKGRLIYSGMHRVSEEVYNQRNQRAVPQEDDLIFAREATAGNVALVQKGEKVCLGQRTVLIRPNKKYVNPSFLTYFLLAPKQQYNLLSTANGATVAHVNLPTIRNLKLELPDILTQHYIGIILSRYDSLIENYQKQIKLLEEAAQRLYKEWFVDLRFPGHENTKIVDGVPEGWEKTNVNNILSFHRGYDLTHKEFVDGPYPVVGSTSIIGNHNKYKIEGPGVVTGRSGSLGVYQLIWDNFWPHNTTLYISDFKGHNVFYIYCLLKTVDFTTLNSGGAIPSLNRNTLSSITVMEPPKSLQDTFSGKVMPMFKRQRHLQSQVRLLTEARDRLLPKLMSGEISVETAQSVTSGLGVRKEQTGSPKPTDS
ncbi:MAG: restriction endonuclease subunit S [Bacteroidaceae bacterium]|nr:restriction endonuclease subunit S [Bacteroidaceae bacterium]